MKAKTENIDIKNNLKNKVEKITEARVLVIGDLMLDKFTYGDVIRISPEAPVPVLHVNHEESYLGGAGNVARNISALLENSYKGKVGIIAVIGKDKSTDSIIEEMNRCNISKAGIITDESRKTITKTRIVAGNQQIVRIDEENTSPFSKSIYKEIEKSFIKNIDDYNVVIMSDYAKGIITEKTAKKIIDICNKKRIPILVDPAIKHFSFYKKATLMTPNLKEAKEGIEALKGLKGIGDKTKTLYRKLKINTIEDLLEHYPRTYLKYDEPVEIADVPIGERVAIRATVNSYVELKKMRTLTVVSFQAKDYTGSLKLVWFNAPFIKQVFHIGQTFIFVGTVAVRNYQKVMEHPEYYSEAQYLEKRKELQPVYPLTEGLTNKRIQKDIKAAGGVIHEMQEYLPIDIPKRYQLMAYPDAVRQIHFPLNYEELEKARHRLVFDEFFLFLLAMRRLEIHRSKIENQYLIGKGTWSQRLIDGLPY